MEEKYERIAHFLGSCTALMECDYRTAGARITEILQGIAASKELTELFTAVTSGFDYGAARTAYLRYPAAPGSNRGVAYLPAERKDLLAFVFCLLVELDAGTLKLDEFLLRYFYVDGSYTAGFLIFTDRVIRPFRDIVASCFPRAAHGGAAEEQTDPWAPADPFVRAGALISAERARITGYLLDDEGTAAAELIFGGLTAAAEQHDVAAFTAILAGYKYFLRFFGIGDRTELFSFAAGL